MIEAIDERVLVRAGVAAERLGGFHHDFIGIAQTPEWRELMAGHDNLVDWLARVGHRSSLKATTWTKVREMAAAVDL